MLNSRVLEVTIGMVVCYASVSLLASSVYEAIASVWKLRAGALLDGVKALLNDPALSGLASEIYNHALVNPASAGKTTRGATPTIKPSYIDPRHFATALIESVQKGDDNFQVLKLKIEEIDDPQIKQLLRGMYARAEGKIENLQKEIGTWFDSAMERLSGGYKRRAQLWTFVIALGIAGLLNIDSIYVFGSLWHTGQVTAAGLTAASSAPDAIEALRGLPIGWFDFDRHIVLTALGWLLTAASVLFGAPFWFGMLQKLVNLRGTGQKPKTEDAGTAKAPT